MRMWWLGLVLGLCACGSSPGKPLHTFPSREKLAQLAVAGPDAKQPITINEIAPEQWQLELPELPSPNPGYALLAAATPQAKPSPALDCVAHEYARIMLQSDGKQPAISLRRFVSARCGAVVAVPWMWTWIGTKQVADSDESIMAWLARRMRKPVDTTAQQAGVAVVRGDGKVVVVAAFGELHVELAPLERVVNADGLLEVRGKALLDADSLHAYINDGEYGVRPCELDPAVAPPAFVLRCQLAAGDDAAWVQLFAMPRGRVLSREVLS